MNFGKNEEKLKIITIAVLLFGICFFTYYFHAVLHKSTVFSHFFYIPLILSSIWWRKKGLIIAVFLAAFLIFSHIFFNPNTIIIDDYFRIFIFISIAFLTVTLSEQVAKASKKIEDLNFMLSAIRNINQLITKTKNDIDLLKRACDEFIKIKGCYTAWITLNNKSIESPITIQAGSNKRFQTLAKKLENRCILACEQKVLLQSDILTINASDPLCANCPLAERDSNKNTLIVNIGVKEKNFGTLAISISKNFALTKDFYSLFKEIAEDIGFALYNIESIKKREQAEKKLQESEKQYHDIFNSTTDSFIIFNFKGNIVEVNSQACKMYGYAYEEMLNLSGKDIVHPDYYYLFKQFRQGLPTKGKFETESVDVRKDGTIFDIEIKGTIFDYQDKPHLLAAIRDVTERKKAAKALEKAYQQLQNTQAQLIQAEKMQIIGRLASGVAHEVKNPLSIILQWSEYLTKKVKTDDEKVSLALNSILNAVTRANNIVEGLLDFSSISKTNIKKVNLNSVLEKSLYLLQPLVDKNNIQIVKSFQENMPDIKIDEDKIGQVFVNLFMNAIQAMSESGELKVSSYIKELPKDNDGVVSREKNVFRPKKLTIIVKIEDTGSGIPPDILDRIFEPFFTTRKKEKGSGLGLSIVKNIIEIHNGNIEICNKKDSQGTIVNVMFKL